MDCNQMYVQKMKKILLSISIGNMIVSLSVLLLFLMLVIIINDDISDINILVLVFHWKETKQKNNKLKACGEIK